VSRIEDLEEDIESLELELNWFRSEVRNIRNVLDKKKKELEELKKN